MEQSDFSLKAQRLSSHKFSLLQHIWSLEVGKVKLNLDRIALSARKLISIGAMYRRTIMITIYENLNYVESY